VAAQVPSRDLSSDGDWLSKAVLKPLTGLAVDGLDHALGMVAHPRRPLQASLGLASKGLQLLQDAAALLLMEDDTPTRLKGKPMGRKLVAWGDPLPLDVVKAVSHGLACSINDLLLTCASGAIGGWLRDQGEDPRGAEIRAMVPVNLRAQAPTWQLGNQFGLAPLVLPVGIANPVERLYAVRARMDQLKRSYQPVLAYGVLGVAGLLVKPGQDLLLGIFSKKTTAVMTNLPGPREFLKLCGATLRQAMFWVPASGDVGVGVSILSYGGGVQFSLITDAALCPDPQAIVDRFKPEFEQLLWLSLMLPWGDGLAV
jgi:WS/DGAT/MGAT family acyltransferase